MTYHSSTTPSSGFANTPSDGFASTPSGGTGNGIRETAREVGSHTAHTGGELAHSVRDQGREVAAEATRQARNLYGETRTQLADQAAQQQRRAAGGLRSLADEMRAMADNSGQSGPVSELARQAADRVHGAAGWLDQRQPGDLLIEVRDYARRNPGTFLVGAALLGVLAGRLTRNLAAHDDGRPAGVPAGAAGATPVPVDSALGSADTVPVTDPDRTAVLPPSTPMPSPAADLGRTEVIPPAPAAVPSPGTGANPPVGSTDPLPGVPSSGARR